MCVSRWRLFNIIFLLCHIKVRPRYSQVSVLQFVFISWTICQRVAHLCVLYIMGIIIEVLYVLLPLDMEMPRFFVLLMVTMNYSKCSCVDWITFSLGSSSLIDCCNTFMCVFNIYIHHCVIATSSHPVVSAKPPSAMCLAEQVLGPAVRLQKNVMPLSIFCRCTIAIMILALLVVNSK